MFKHDGLSCYVPGTWPGDTCVVEIIPEKSTRKFFYATLIELITPSPDRTKVPCRHWGLHQGQCLGCPWLMVDYRAQLNEKMHHVRKSLERVGFDSQKLCIRDIIASQATMGYRNRAQVKTDGTRLGFVSPNSHVIADIETCHVLTPGVNQALTELRKELPNEHWKPSPGHDFNFIDIDELWKRDELTLNQRRPFQQGNTHQNIMMQQWLAQELNLLDNRQTLLELFCGSGNFTKIIRDAGFTTVTAVDVIGPAFQKLRVEIPQYRITELNLSEIKSVKLLDSFVKNPKILVLDPPRSGFKWFKSCLQQFSGLQTVIYISCDLESFSHDSRTLIDHGYTIQHIQPVDQFPHTPHVEILARFERLQRA
jgi:23S rRNA (uracil1939-C5)-methyltransferase